MLCLPSVLAIVVGLADILRLLLLLMDVGIVGVVTLLVGGVVGVGVRDGALTNFDLSTLLLRKAGASAALGSIIVSVKKQALAPSVNQVLCARKKQTTPR